MSSASLQRSSPLRGSQGTLLLQNVPDRGASGSPRPVLELHCPCSALAGHHLLLRECLLEKACSSLPLLPFDLPRVGSRWPNPLKVGIKREQARVPLSPSSLLAEPSHPGPVSTATTLTKAFPNTQDKTPPPPSPDTPSTLNPCYDTSTNSLVERVPLYFILPPSWFKPLWQAASKAAGIHTCVQSPPLEYRQDLVSHF